MQLSLLNNSNFKIKIHLSAQKYGSAAAYAPTFSCCTMCCRSIGIVILLQPVSFPFGTSSVPLRYSAKEPTFRTACLQKSLLQPPPP